MARLTAPMETDFFCLPPGINGERIEDNILSEAFESTPPLCRAAVKTAIALANFHFLPNRANGTAGRSINHLGFWQKCVYKPVSTVFLVFPASYTSAAQICAAACLPLLSGAQQVIACSSGGTPAPKILATLELCGVEDIFSIETASLCPLLENQPESAPIIILGGTQLKNLIKALIFLKKNIYIAPPTPSLCLLTPAAFNPEILEFTHDTKCFSSLPIAECHFDAIFIDQKKTHLPENISGRLILEPGCECFWLFPNFTPEFFIEKNLSFGFIKDDDPI